LVVGEWGGRGGGGGGGGQTEVITDNMLPVNQLGSPVCCLKDNVGIFRTWTFPSHGGDNGLTWTAIFEKLIQYRERETGGNSVRRCVSCERVSFVPPDDLGS